MKFNFVKLPFCFFQQPFCHNFNYAVYEKFSSSINTHRHVLRPRYDLCQELSQVRDPVVCLASHTSVRWDFPVYYCTLALHSMLNR